jgi:hypothetical protein
MKDSLESGGLNGTAYGGRGGPHLEKVHAILEQGHGESGQDRAHRHSHQELNDGKAAF